MTSEAIHNTVMDFLDTCVRAVQDDERRMKFNFGIKALTKYNLRKIVQDDMILKDGLIGIVKWEAKKYLKGTSDLALILSNVESYYKQSMLTRH